MFSMVRKSPACNKDKARICVRGYADPNNPSALDLAMLVRVLRDTPALKGCLIGSSVLPRDSSSLVVEFGDIDALDEVCIQESHEILVISGRKALITTLQSKQI